MCSYSERGTGHFESEYSQIQIRLLKAQLALNMRDMGFRVLSVDEDGNFKFSDKPE